MKIPQLLGSLRLRRLLQATAAALTVCACARQTKDPRLEEMRRNLDLLRASQILPPEGVDVATLSASVTSDTVAPGLVHYRLRFPDGPWVVNVLDVNLQACWTPIALKAGTAAVGRAKTTQLLEQVLETDSARQLPIVAGVNADFFRFTPPGVPVAAHIRGGRVIAGPSQRPVLGAGGAEDSRPWIGLLADTGFVVIAGDTFPLNAWNRAAPEGLALFDEDWGPIVDSTSGAVEVVIATAPRPMESILGGPARRLRRRGLIDGTITAIDTSVDGVAPRDGQVVLVAGAKAPEAIRARLRRLRVAADSIRIHSSLRVHPHDAVGGFPILLRRGIKPDGLDSAGGRGFGPVRHPRTAVGITRSAMRLYLVTVDGRQPGYSEGMTLLELAELMFDLGSRDALNLDGGGSTAMAVSQGPNRTRILNRPSDSAGERAVSNALAVVPVCGASMDSLDGIRVQVP